MPALTFNIRKDGLTALQDKKITVKEFIESVLSEDNGRAIMEITPWLTEFHKQDGGSPVTSAIKIADAEYDFTTHAGKVKMAYKVSVTFGCADIFRTDNYFETSNFTIDAENKKLTLFITDQLTRDTVDEF